MIIYIKGSIEMNFKIINKWFSLLLIFFMIGLLFVGFSNGLLLKNKNISNENNDNSISISYLDGYTNITVNEAWDMLSDVNNGIQIPIDVRYDEEWAKEHIDTPSPENPRHHCTCAWNETIIQEFVSLYQGEEIIIYCRSGFRSFNAVKTLINHGFIGTIYNMVGGIISWRGSGLPTIANQPPDLPLIIGPSSGAAGIEYEYTFISNDPEGDELYYKINWSDNSSQVWSGPYSSEEEARFIHNWTERDIYLIQVISKDIYGNQSDWAVLEVSMIKNRTYHNTYFLKMFEKNLMISILLQIIGSIRV